MKTNIIAIAASAVVLSATGYAKAGSFENHFGGQEGVNAHFQGTDNRHDEQLSHLERATSGNKAWNGRQQQQIDNNTAWNDRQEGVIRQNRGRLDENDALNQRQNDSIDNAHARIGGVKQQVDANSESIGFLNEAQTITSERVNANASAITATQARVEDVNKASVNRDRVQDNDIRQVESESVERDTVIAQQVDYNEQVNAAYRRQSAAQFEQHGAAIESNRQAIANERNERQQMGKDLNAGVAGALAAAAATFDPSYYGVQLSVSGGSYRGESAVGLSVGARATESLFINGGVVHDSRGHQGFNAAANWKF